MDFYIARVDWWADGSVMAQVRVFGCHLAALLLLCIVRCCAVLYCAETGLLRQTRRPY